MSLERRQAIPDRQNVRNAYGQLIKLKEGVHIRGNVMQIQLLSRRQREAVNMHVESFDVILLVSNPLLLRTLCITYRIIPMIDASNDSLVRQSNHNSEPRTNQSEF